MRRDLLRSLQPLFSTVLFYGFVPWCSADGCWGQPRGLVVFCLRACQQQGLTIAASQVCLTCCSRDVMVKVDQICHKNSIKFFTGDIFGYHGYMFANLGEHEFVE